MPRRIDDAHLFELAKRGAKARLGELVQEAKYLIDLFPHLRDSFDKDELPMSVHHGEERWARDENQRCRASATADVRCRSEEGQRSTEEAVGGKAEDGERIDDQKRRAARGSTSDSAAI